MAAKYPDEEWSADMRRMFGPGGTRRVPGPVEPPMSPSGKSYYSGDEDPREPQERGRGRGRHEDEDY